LEILLLFERHMNLEVLLGMNLHIMLLNKNFH